MNQIFSIIAARAVRCAFGLYCLTEGLAWYHGRWNAGFSPAERKLADSLYRSVSDRNGCSKPSHDFA